MGQWDYKNWLIKVELKEDLTDPQIVDYLSKHAVFSLKEYLSFKSTLVRPLHTGKAEQIVRFFLEYHNGELYPDRYNCFEPVRKVFSEDILPSVIEHLCWAGGCLYLKKLRKFDVDIENQRFAVCFTDGLHTPSKGIPPENKTLITMYYDKKKVKDCSTLYGLANDMVAALGAVKGAVIDQEDFSVVYDCPIPE